MHTRTSPRRDLDQIPMCPNSRMLGKIGSMESFAGCIAINSERTRRKRFCANQVSDRAASPLRRDECANIQTETATLRFACVHREVWVTQDETTNDICAAGNRLHGDGAHVLPHPMILIVVENRASRQERAKSPEVDAQPLWRVASNLAHPQERRTCPERGHLFLGYDSPKVVRIYNRPIVENDFGAGGKC